MRLNAPKKITWIIALIAGGLAILSRFTTLPFVTDNNFWILALGWLLLLLGTYVRDL